MVCPDVVEEHARQDEAITIGKFRQALLQRILIRIILDGRWEVRLFDYG